MRRKRRRKRRRKGNRVAEQTCKFKEAGREEWVGQDAFALIM